MEQQSRARWLEAAALGVASSGGTLNLTHMAGKTLPDPSVWLDQAQPGERVVIVQARATGFPAEMAKRIGPGGSVTVVLAERGPPDAQTPATQDAHLRFVRAEFGDLSTCPRSLAALLAQSPPKDLESYHRFNEALRRQRRDEPWIAPESVDVVVLDLVDLVGPDRPQIEAALDEAFRVMRRHGRIVVSALLQDQRGGSDAKDTGLLELELSDRLAASGFHGISYQWRAALPVRLEDGVETRAHVLVAYKGKQGECLDQGHAVVYRGPWREVHDDDDHRYVRGERTAVCGKTFDLLTRRPYAADFIPLEPYVQRPAEGAPPFDCNTPALRDPRVTKGVVAVGDSCAGGSCC